MKRVVKNGGVLLITTSAGNKKEDVFHEKTRGWCFSQESLRKMGSLNEFSPFEYEKSEKSILSSDKWFSRIDTYYTGDPESEFYRKQIKRLDYLPVGIKLVK